MKTIIWNGETITKAGVYSDVPLDKYHSQDICDGPSVSSSGLRRVLEENGGSPAHFYCEWSGNPERVEPAESAALTFGRAAHHLLLGQSFFSKSFVIRPQELPDKHGILTEWHSNKTVCKDWMERAARGQYVWDAKKTKWTFDPAQGPLTVLKGEEAIAILDIQKSLLAHTIIKQGVLGGKVERSMFWKDRRTGLWLKSRPDAVPTDSGDFADLKTTTSVQWKDLVRTISMCAYHQQAALIFEGAKICAGIDGATFTLVFVERKPPHCVCCVMLRQEAIELGKRQNRRALDIIKTCIERKFWPGPNEGDVLNIDLSERYEQDAKLNCDTYDGERQERVA